MGFPLFSPKSSAIDSRGFIFISFNPSLTMYLFIPVKGTISAPTLIATRSIKELSLLGSREMDL